MKKTNTENQKKSIAAEAFARLGRHAYSLHLMGASLRLISALMCLVSYSSIYKLIINHNCDAVRGIRRRPPQEEQEILAEWERRNPELAEAMRDRDITPRRWCYLYGILRDDDHADIYALIDTLRYEYDHDIELRELLKKDFPAAYGLALKTYWSAEVETDLYFLYEKVFSKHEARHIFWNDSLNIKVINKSDFLAHAIFQKRLLQEVRDRRMVMLLESGLNDENIRAALAWLPDPISANGGGRKIVNMGTGYIAMREAEERHRLECEERKKSKTTG